MEEEQTYESVLKEIAEVKKNMKLYDLGDIFVPEGFSYKEAVVRLLYLQRRKVQLRKSRKKDEEL